MAHINYPEDYAGSSELFKKIKKKHDADVLTPEGSVLTPYLTEQGIDLDADEVLVNASDTAHTSFQANDKLSEELREKRDNIINPAFKDHRPMVQYLKKLKRGKVHELGEWGVTVTGTDRIDYPADFPTLRMAIKNFIDKHNTYTTPPSPLKPYLDEHTEIDLSARLTALGDSLTYHTDFNKANRDAEEDRELRDTTFSLPYKHVLGMGQYLMGLLPDTPHKLGQWGFTIDEHTRLRERTITLDAGQKMDLSRMAIGTKVTVTGEGEIAITPKTKLPSLKGTRAVTNKDNPFTLRYGFGNSTVENLSLDKKVTFTFWYHS